MSTTKSFKRGCNGRRHHKFFTPVYDTFYNALVIIERYWLITVLLHPVVLPEYCLLIDSPIIDCSLATGSLFCEQYRRVPANAAAKQVLINIEK